MVKKIPSGKTQGIWFAKVLNSLFLKLKDISMFAAEIPNFFRVVKTTLSSSYNISELVPVCWLLFQCF